MLIQENIFGLIDLLQISAKRSSTFQYNFFSLCKKNEAPMDAMSKIEPRHLLQGRNVEGSAFVWTWRDILWQEKAVQATSCRPRIHLGRTAVFSLSTKNVFKKLVQRLQQKSLQFSIKLTSLLANQNTTDDICSSEDPIFCRSSLSLGNVQLVSLQENEVGGKIATKHRVI